MKNSKLHSKLHCVYAEAKVFTFSFEREAMILGAGYFTQVFAGHYYTFVVASIYTALACRPAIKAAKTFKQQAEVPATPTR